LTRPFSKCGTIAAAVVTVRPGRHCENSTGHPNADNGETDLIFKIRDFCSSFLDAHCRRGANIGADQSGHNKLDTLIS
jgi:hypothetical protein